MKMLYALLLSSACLYGQAPASASITFGTDTVGTTLTVSAQAFPVLIAKLETTPAPGTSPTTLSVALTTGATTISLASAAGVLPGMGIEMGTCPGAGCVVSIVKAAGCTNNVCTVLQGTLGTTPAAFPINTPVTIIQDGSGESRVCRIGSLDLQGLAAAGGATYNAPSNAQLASTTIATANAAIATQVATIGGVIAAAATCAPNQ